MTAARWRSLKFYWESVLMNGFHTGRKGIYKNHRIKPVLTQDDNELSCSVRIVKKMLVIFVNPKFSAAN